MINSYLVNNFVYVTTRWDDVIPTEQCRGRDTRLQLTWRHNVHCPRLDVSTCMSWWYNWCNCVLIYIWDVYWYVLVMIMSWYVFPMIMSWYVLVWLCPDIFLSWLCPDIMFLPWLCPDMSLSDYVLIYQGFISRIIVKINQRVKWNECQWS